MSRHELAGLESRLTAAADNDGDVLSDAEVDQLLRLRRQQADAARAARAAVREAAAERVRQRLALRGVDAIKVALADLPGEDALDHQAVDQAEADHDQDQQPTGRGVSRIVAALRGR